MNSKDELEPEFLGQYSARRSFFSTHSSSLDSITYPRGKTNCVFFVVFNWNTSPGDNRPGFGRTAAVPRCPGSDQSKAQSSRCCCGISRFWESVAAFPL